MEAAQWGQETGMFFDWEVPSVTTPMARDFLGKCDAKWGRMTSLYSYAAFLNEHLGAAPDSVAFSSQGACVEFADIEGRLHDMLEIEGRYRLRPMAVVPG